MAGCSPRRSPMPISRAGAVDLAVTYQTSTCRANRWWSRRLRCGPVAVCPARSSTRQWRALPIGVGPAAIVYVAQSMTLGASYRPGDRPAARRRRAEVDAQHLVPATPITAVQAHDGGRARGDPGQSAVMLGRQCALLGARRDGKGEVRDDDGERRDRHHHCGAGRRAPWSASLCRGRRGLGLATGGVRPMNVTSRRRNRRPSRRPRIRYSR